MSKAELDLDIEIKIKQLEYLKKQTGHLWWLALWCKVSLGIIIVGFLAMITALYDS